MGLVESTLAALPRDPRLESQLADHATDAVPVWLWSADGPRILWANAVGAAAFGAGNSGECASRRSTPSIRPPLRSPGSPQRCRRPGKCGSSACAALAEASGVALTCICSRIALSNEAPAILLVATEPAGPSLPLRERVSRLFAGREQTLIAFTPDGSLLYATPSARARLGDAVEPAGAWHHRHRRRRARGRQRQGNDAARPGDDRTSRSRCIGRAGRSIRRTANEDHAAESALPRKVPACATRPSASRWPASARPLPATTRRGRRRTAPPVALCLADGRRRPLRGRLGRIHRADGPANHGGIRPAVERDRRRAEARSRQSDRACGRHPRDLERHHRLLAGGRRRRTPAGRVVGTAGVRP